MASQAAIFAPRLGPYRVLCAICGVVFALTGVALFATFFAYHAPGGEIPLPTGPTGVYFVAFAGCALVGWGGALLGAARRPEAGRTVGTATALALVLSGLFRMVAWVMGDYYASMGEAPRYEAALFLALALAFVWLRAAPAPARATRRGPGALGWLATAAIASLLVLDLALPSTAIGRRGSERMLRADVPSAAGRVGEQLPDFELPDLDGAPVRLSDFRGQRVLLTFERSLDW